MHLFRLIGPEPATQAASKRWVAGGPPHRLTDGPDGQALVALVATPRSTTILRSTLTG